MDQNKYSMFGRLLLSHFVPTMKKASFEAALKGKKQIAEGAYEFVFERPMDFHFNAGQHIRMTLLNPPETDGKGNSRFLTLANTPQDKYLVVAMRMTDSSFKRVLGQMQTGEKVLIQILLHSPHGSFVIHDDASIPAVFLIGGIGIIPAFSMIKDTIERKLLHKIYLFYSNRRSEDAPYLDELQNFAKQNPNFKLIATMTEDKTWKGEKGFINQSMIRKYVNDLQTPIYYIAGLTGMVNAMKALVKDLGVSEDNIKAEDFEGFKMGQMNDAMENVKKHLLPGVIVLMVVVIVHVGAAVSKFNTFSFKNLSFLTIGLILAIIIFKVFVIKHFLGFKQGKEKL